jgi:YegS/Rv2252/BmrU family lipid kinase
MQYLAVVNPAAGGGQCGRNAAAAVARLRESGLDVDVVETTEPGDGTAIVAEAYRKGQRHFIAVGGDGTSYEIVNGILKVAEPDAQNGGRATLGFLPLGTGNSFLRDFTEEGSEYSIRALIEGAKRSCDVIRLTHLDGVLHYINILSLGFVAEVNGLRSRRFKRFGEGGYVMAVLTEVARLQSSVFPMRVDDGPLQSNPVAFLSINNSRFTGGKMMMAPDADTADGKADLIEVGQLGRLALVREFPKIFKGTHVHNPAVSTRQVRTIDFELAEEVDVMVDGEALRVIPTRLEVLPGAIDVRV